MDGIPSIVAAPICALEAEQKLRGYLAGFRNAPVPPEAQSDAYWQGWHNGRRAGGHTDQEAIQVALALDLLNDRF